MNQIQLGCTYRDKITGFEGVATGHVTYISGCNQTLLVPRVGADNKASESSWFDDQRMQLCETDQVVLDNGATPGCDRAAPRR